MVMMVGDGVDGGHGDEGGVGLTGASSVVIFFRGIAVLHHR